MRARNFKRTLTDATVRLNGMPVDDLLATKIVWAHHIGYGLPDYQTEQSVSKEFYNDNAPLELYANNNIPRPTHGVARLLESGINGLQVDIINGTWSDPFVMMGDFLNDADESQTDPNPNKRFYIAPCLDTPGFSEDDIKNYLQSYIAKAQSTTHPSLAKVNGKYVIYCYGAYGVNGISVLPNYDATSISASTTIWQHIRDWITANNIPVYIIRDIGFNAAYNNYNLVTKGIDLWNNGLFDAAYSFDLFTPAFWKMAVPYINSRQIRYFGGLQPEYNRESIWGGYIDAGGTSLLRSELTLLEQSRSIPWNNIVTWSDSVENTQIRPTTNWHKTRADIVNFYSARFRGIAPVHTAPTLYVTTRMFVTVGEAFLAEGMVINPSTQTAAVSIQLYAADRITKRGASVRVDVRGGTTGSATTSASLTATSIDVGSYYYAYAVSYDTAGNQLESVWSAPIAIYAALQNPIEGNNDISWTTNNWPYDNARAGYSPYSIRHRYYSIPAYAALTSRPTVTTSGNPALITTPTTTNDASKPTATITAPAGVTIRSIELLQNTQLVKRVLSTDASAPTSMTVAIPAGNQSTKYLNYQQVNPKGYYVARIITSDEKVSYSDPLYFG